MQLLPSIRSYHIHLELVYKWRGFMCIYVYSVEIKLFHYYFKILFPITQSITPHSKTFSSLPSQEMSKTVSEFYLLIIYKELHTRSKPILNNSNLHLFARLRWNRKNRCNFKIYDKILPFCNFGVVFFLEGFNNIKYIIYLFWIFKPL